MGGVEPHNRLSGGDRARRPPPQAGSAAELIRYYVQAM